MDKNTRHLLSYWAVALVCAVLLVVAVVAAIRRSDFLVPSVVGLSLGISALRAWYRKRKLEMVFQERTAAPAVAMFRKSLSRVPHGQVMSASLCGLVFALYGDFDAARDEINLVSVRGVPPVYEAMQVHVLAVLALLQEKNYQKAAELAGEMRELCLMSAAVPGSKRTRRATDAFCDACDLLVGSDTNGTAERLESIVSKLRPIDRIVIAWALGRYFTRAGDAGRAAKYDTMVRKLAPYCTPLTQS